MTDQDASPPFDRHEARKHAFAAALGSLWIEYQEFQNDLPSIADLASMLLKQQNEIAGYKARAELCEANEHKFVVALTVDKGSPSMSVFGPSPSAERRFGETLIRYCGLLGFMSKTTQQDVKIAELRLAAQDMADAAGSMICDVEFFLDANMPDKEQAESNLRETLKDAEDSIRKFRQMP